jgi:hypothetical protein
MPHASKAIVASIALAACGGDVVAPSQVALRPPDALLAAQPEAPLVAPAASTKTITISTTAGLDDALERLIPALGASAAALEGPLSLLRDDLTVANSSARVALLTAAVGAFARYQARASADEQADLAAIQLVLDAVRVDDAGRDTSK